MRHLGGNQLAKLVFMAIISLPAFSHAQTADREKMRQRLEQLFIWKVSDRLQLSPEKENKLTADYKNLSAEKTKLSQQLDDISDEMERQKTDPKRLTKLLADYKVASKKYNDSQDKELDVMGHILNSEQLAEYVLLKREMFHKFRDVLTMSGGAKTAENVVAKPSPLKEPEVYQEK